MLVLLSMAISLRLYFFLFVEWVSQEMFWNSRNYSQQYSAGNMVDSALQADNLVVASSLRGHWSKPSGARSTDACGDDVGLGTENGAKLMPHIHSSPLSSLPISYTCFL